MMINIVAIIFLMAAMIFLYRASRNREIKYFKTFIIFDFVALFGNMLVIIAHVSQ
jgi:hypothetical protein